MKKSLLLASSLLLLGSQAFAETVSIGGKDYELQRLIEREIGPGVTYTRLRLPDYPLNVNVTIVDMNNPYNRIETTVAKESARGTESLVAAAQRQSYEGHRALAAANGNFWIVNTQPEDQIWTGITRNVSLRNGKMITESNQHRDQWDGGTMRTGIVSCSYDKLLTIDYCKASIKVWSDKFDAAEVHQCNKGIWDDEIGMYNSHFGASNQFMPITSEGGKYKIDAQNDATEVILDFDEGQSWVSGSDMTFVVKEVRLDAGRGTLGNHDLALVGRGDNRALLAKLEVGDKVNMKYTWTFNPGAENETSPAIEQAIGGNALVMRYGELTAHNDNEGYNSQVYSRCGYGCSQDGKKLFIVVIDKSTDPVYGSSKGCSSAVMCEIARHLGCWNMANFDAGGSAEMMINDQIINKTTEGTPRAVANGWMVYSIAPEDDNTVARLEFYDHDLVQPIYASSSPAVIAYNKYGAVIDYDYKDVTFSCDPSLGSCEGNVFTAAGTACTGMLTASCGDVTVSKEMNIVGAQVQLRSKAILIDANREYPVEVNASTAGKTYTYDPAHIAWTVEDPTVASIDENGVLRGIKNGTTKITGTIGEFTDEGEVTVEIADAPTLPICAMTDWAVKASSGITNAKMDEEGATTFTYGSPRTPYLEYSVATDFYSLPDEVYCEFNSELAIKTVTLTVKAANDTRETPIKIENDFTAGVDQHVAFNLAENLDLNDIAIFPITFKRVRLAFAQSASNKGARTLTWGGVHGEYAHYDAIDDVRIDDLNGSADRRLAVMPNPAMAGESVTLKANSISEVAVFSISGSLVSTKVCDGSDSAIVEAPLAAGTYVVSAMTSTGRKSGILIVK